MDYTDDACMDRFTACQVTRMRNQLANIAFYKNLWTSANFTATGGDIATSLNDITSLSQGEIKLYPNPFKNNITIISRGIGNIKEPYRILNAYGQEIKRGVLTTNTETINLDGMNDGVYFIEYKKQSHKIIKQE
jgi:hypothetical protein